MDLYEEILQHALQEGKLAVNVENLKLSPEEITKNACYGALAEIHAILADRTLDDPACFAKIEEIVGVFEALGSTGGGRHDFG